MSSLQHTFFSFGEGSHPKMEEFKVTCWVPLSEVDGEIISSKWLGDLKGDGVRSSLVAQEVAYLKREDTLFSF